MHDLSHLIERKTSLTRYPWHQMQIGDYFVVPSHKANSIKSNSDRRTQLAGHSYTIQRMERNKSKIVRIDPIESCKTRENILNWLYTNHAISKAALVDIEKAIDMLLTMKGGKTCELLMRT